MSSITTVSNIKVTKEFLANALGKHAEILTFVVTPGTKPGDNYMSLIYKIEVHFRSKSSGTSTEDELTRYLLIKCYNTAEGLQAFFRKSNIFFKELEIYRSWMPELRRFQAEVIGLDKPLKLPYAPYVYGNCMDFKSMDETEATSKTLGPLDNFIILEDLQKTWGFQMTDKYKGLDFDHMQLVISAVAKIHAASWAYRNQVKEDVIGKFPFFKAEFTLEDKAMWMGTINFNIKHTISLLNKNIEQERQLIEAIAKFEHTADPVFDTFHFTRDETNLEKLLRTKPNITNFGSDSVDPEPWSIICHGDCWSNNMLFQYNSDTGKPFDVILVDLQFARETCIVNDLVYILYVCAEKNLRQNHLDELLNLYYDKFNEVCSILKTKTLPGFTIESFKFRFHRAKLFGLFMTMLCLPTMMLELDKKDDHAINLDESVQFQNFTDVSGEHPVGSTPCNNNNIIKERLIEVLQDLFDDGVI